MGFRAAGPTVGMAHKRPDFRRNVGLGELMLFIVVVREGDDMGEFLPREQDLLADRFLLGRDLDEAAPGRRQGGMVSVRALSPGRP